MIEDRTSDGITEEFSPPEYEKLLLELEETLDVRSGLAAALDVIDYRDMCAHIADVLDVPAGLRATLNKMNGSSSMNRPVCSASEEFDRFDNATEEHRSHHQNRRNLNRLPEVEHKIQNRSNLQETFPPRADPCDPHGPAQGAAIQLVFPNRIGLFLLIMVVISGASVILAAMMSDGTAKNLIIALAVVTVIAAIVGFGQTVITALATQKTMVAPLVPPLIEENRRALKELSAEYRSLNREFFPTHVFEAANAPDPAFNDLMIQDLRNTRQIFFRGFSGRHAAARLLLASSGWELRMTIADPRERTAITGRARYLIRHEGVVADFETIQDRLHEEISIGLVGLYLARSRCTRIDVTLISNPPLDCMEMLDDSVWITLYSDFGATALYPRALRFSERSFIYNMERAEFGRLCQTRGANHLVLTPGTSRAEFTTMFEKVTATRLSEDRFIELEAKFHTFRQEFSLAAALGI